MKASYLCILLLTTSLTASAQFGFAPYTPMGGGMAFSKAKIISGDPRVLAGKKIQVTLIFDGMVLADYDNERSFVDAMVAHYEKKKAGLGLRWAADWEADKDHTFRQLFIDKYNDMASESGSVTRAQADTAGAPYYLIITTTALDPGYNAWIAKDPARIDATCDFRDASGRSVLVVSMEHVPGQTFGMGDMNVHVRIGECYAKLAKDLYKFISKKSKSKKDEGDW